MSGDSEDAVRALPWPEREAQLLQRLGEKPYLFVLDGLERILIAYHRMDASTLADDEVDQQTANLVAGAVGLPSLGGADPSLASIACAKPPTRAPGHF